MEISEIHSKILNKCELSMEEVYYYLDYLNKDVIRVTGLNECNLTKCKEVCIIICFKYTYNFDGKDFSSVPLNLNEIGIDNLTHYTSFIRFKTTEGFKCYILDPTMPQFNSDEYMIDNGKIIDIKNNINETQEEIINDFKIKGYVEATPDNLVQFINIFINSLIKNGIHIDKKTIHENFSNFCEKNKLISRDTPQDSKKMNSEKIL